VDDLARGIDLFMKKDDGVPGPINFGNPVEVTIKQLAETIVQMTGSRSQITYQPLPSDDPERRKPDISAAQALLGWNPIIDLDKGLAQTIDYFSHRLSREGGLR
jgi:UDP-glucuronate decarboxylase